MSSFSTSDLAINDIVEQRLDLKTCDLMKLDSTDNLVKLLYSNMIQMDNHLLCMDHYLQFMRRVDKWCDNLTQIIHCFRSVQMSVTKARVNTGRLNGSESPVDEIDGL